MNEFDWDKLLQFIRFSNFIPDIIYSNHKCPGLPGNSASFGVRFAIIIQSSNNTVSANLIFFVKNQIDYFNKVKVPF